ncbi:MAG: PsiF family protein, partial [Nevskiales bacterium]
AKTKALKGDDRKAFMKTCLSKDGGASMAAAAPAAPATPAAAAPVSAKAAQQQKMKDCNAEATSKTLKGADRKTFMSTCLKG